MIRRQRKDHIIERFAWPHSGGKVRTVLTSEKLRAMRVTSQQVAVAYEMM